jgi:hypothetical protein
MMFIAKKQISRRTLLRGIGVAVALPVLESMVPAQTPLRKTAASPRSRLACLEMVHGSAGSSQTGKHYWSPERTGSDFDFSYILEPLRPYRKFLTVISGTDVRPAEALAPNEVGADHFRSSAVFLTGAHPKQTSGADIFNGVSIDQVYAQRFGQDTRVPSIQLCIETVESGSTCGWAYDCVYNNTISWASPTTPLPMTINPRVAFENLFRGDEPEAQANRERERHASRSVLDGVGSDVARLNRELGTSDRARLSQYLEEIREIERRIEAIEKRNATADTRELAAAPIGVPDSWEEHVKLMFDLQVLAFAAEVTRVSAFKMSQDVSDRVFPESGVKRPFHSLSHHFEKPAELAEFAKLNRYHIGLISYFLERLKNTPDGDGSLLDHSLVLYGSPMGDSHTHEHRRVPLFLAGHASGAVKGNLHCTSPAGTPQANALLTVLHRLEVQLDSIGDSTGEIAI